MNPIDIFLVIIIVAAVVAAFFSIRKQKRDGKACTGDCAGCNRSCKH
ncbi:MAG: FeoB-associated Cys-rich membrane protein [Wujia sp.]